MGDVTLISVRAAKCDACGDSSGTTRKATFLNVERTNAGGVSLEYFGRLMGLIHRAPFET
jgi:hypothetical protein